MKFFAGALLVLAFCLILAGLTWPDFARGHRLGCFVGAFALCVFALLAWPGEAEG